MQSIDARVFAIGLALILSSTALRALALEPYAATPSEIARMIDYCQVKLNRGLEAKDRVWRQRFGALWIDMHHYCHGLKFVQRASRPGISQQERSFNLTSSLSEFEYILRSTNAAGGHWFLPEVHLQRSLVYRRLGQHAKATAELQKAQAARK